MNTMINNLKNNENIRQLISYALVGTCNFILDIGVINLLMFIFKIYKGPILIIFNILSFVTYSINGYFFNKKFTFKSNKNSYFKYASVLGIFMLINGIIFSLLSLYNILNISQILWANISKSIASMLSGFLAFLVNKFFVFKH